MRFVGFAKVLLTAFFSLSELVNAVSAVTTCAPASETSISPSGHHCGTYGRIKAPKKLGDRATVDSLQSCTTLFLESALCLSFAYNTSKSRRRRSYMTSLPVRAQLYGQMPLQPRAVTLGFHSLLLYLTFDKLAGRGFAPQFPPFAFLIVGWLACMAYSYLRRWIEPEYPVVLYAACIWFFGVSFFDLWYTLSDPQSGMRQLWRILVGGQSGDDATEVVKPSALGPQSVPATKAMDL